MIEQLSIDLTNYCSKQCAFCYNHSLKEGFSLWEPQEVINFAIDCINNGVKAISLGGGEPFEYPGIFKIIRALCPKCFLSVTSNGLPLQNNDIINLLKLDRPDKIHISIHNPEQEIEISRAENLIKVIKSLGIKPGINLLISHTHLKEAKKAYIHLRQFLSEEQIILIPMRFETTPSAKEISNITGNKPFQSPSCLLGCSKPENFCSVSWDKKVNWCSFAKGKIPLKTLDFKGLITALSLVNFIPCNS